MAVSYSPLELEARKNCLVSGQYYGGDKCRCLPCSACRRFEQNQWGFAMRVVKPKCRPLESPETLETI